MSIAKIVGILLIAAGALGLMYGGFMLQVQENK
jgi:hypothetical protein